MSWSPRVPIDKTGRAAVAPSLLSADFSKLGEEVTAAERAGADLFHLDIMDGHFVPNLTFGPMIVRAIRKLTRLPLDTHLMIERPADTVAQFAKAGSDIITIHVEASDDPRRDLRAIREAGKGAGITLNPDTSIEKLIDYFEDIDLLLVMSVFPGFAGQSFMPDVLEKVETARRIRDDKRLGFAIEIDGGINPDTAVRARQAGVDILVAGSAVFGRPDYAEAIRAIRGAP